MAENVMSFANENVSGRSVPAHDKAGLHSAESQTKAQPALAAKTDSARSPLVNKLKPKQSYLRRGTGLQSRLTAAKNRRYVPKGGFIKGQAEDEGCQLSNDKTYVDFNTSNLATSNNISQPQRHTMPREFVESKCVGSSSQIPELCMASEANHAQQEHSYLQFAHLHQANSFGIAQFHASADIEAELDADTALVHFPHGAHDDQHIQGQDNYSERHFRSQCQPEEQQQLPGRQGSQSSMHSAVGLHHLSMSAGQTASTGVSDWQVQQAAEALELEEFRALERQITQDSGSVRGSIASLSSMPAWQRHNSSAAIHRPTGLHHMLPQHQPPHLEAVQKPERQQSARSPLSETNELLLEHVQGVRQVAAQRPPPRVTGNPFADPEETYDLDEDSQRSAPMAAQHELGDSALSSQLPAPRHEAFREPFAYTDGGAECAWDALSATAAPSANTNYESQDVLQPDNPSQKYIQQMFKRQQPQVVVEKKSPQSQDKEAVAIAALEQEMKALKDDKAHVSKLQSQLEQASMRMEQEKAAWKRQQSDEAAAWEAEKEAESQRLKRHQRVLDKQSRALLKLPNRKERSEVEAVEAVLEQERKASNAKDARHKLTVERLRQKLVELQDTNAELREEIRFHEQRRLDEWNAKKNKQPGTSSRGRGGTAPSEAAASTSRSNKVEQSTQEASSQPVMQTSHSILHGAPARGSQAHAPALGDAHHMPAAGGHPASTADGASEDCDNDEAMYTEAAKPTAEAWQNQSHAGWMQASMAQHEHGRSVSPAAAVSQQTEHEWPSNSQAYPFNPDVSQPLPPQRASQGMSAFQPITDMRLQSTSSYQASSASTGLQQARQPAAMAADRYRHATVLASPEDDFVWRPIRPQTSQHSEQYAAAHDTATAGSHTVLMANTTDSQDPSWMTHLAPVSGTQCHSRSLRESLDAAARFDSRLQLAQQKQQQQQQQQQEPHWPVQDSQWHRNQGRNEPASMLAQASSSWQDIQNPRSVGQPAASEHAANMLHRQQPHSKTSVPPQREVMPRIDRAGPQKDTLPGRQGQSYRAPTGSSSADWSSHAAGSDAVLQARLHGSRLSSMLGIAQHDSSAAGASQQGSTELAAHEKQHDTSSGKHDLGSGHHAEAIEPLPAAGSDPQHPCQELNYPDGKVEQVFLDGRRSVLFANGTRKQQFPDGHTTIRFTNRDIKRFFPCGRVEYYYCEVDTWHTTHASGIEVFYFPNGQTEAHHPSGTKEIIFPDSVIRRVFPDGREQDVTPEQLSSPVKHPIPEDKD